MSIRIKEKEEEIDLDVTLHGEKSGSGIKKKMSLHLKEILTIKKTDLR